MRLTGSMQHEVPAKYTKRREINSVRDRLKTEISQPYEWMFPRGFRAFRVFRGHLAGV